MKRKRQRNRLRLEKIEKQLRLEKMRDLPYIPSYHRPSISVTDHTGTDDSIDPCNPHWWGPTHPEWDQRRDIECKHCAYKNLDCKPTKLYCSMCSRSMA